jgi:hypothetical protein
MAGTRSLGTPGGGGYNAPAPKTQKYMSDVVIVGFENTCLPNAPRFVSGVSKASTQVSAVSKACKQVQMRPVFES